MRKFDTKKRPDALETVIDAAESEITLTPAQEWITRLTAIANRHRPTVHQLDDSRESIYD